jgi:hypothetical protein
LVLTGNKSNLFFPFGLGTSVLTDNPYPGVDDLGKRLSIVLSLKGLSTVSFAEDISEL